MIYWLMLKRAHRLWERHRQAEQMCFIAGDGLAHYQDIAERLATKARKLEIKAMDWKRRNV